MGTRIKSVHVKLDLRTYIVGTWLIQNICEGTTRFLEILVPFINKYEYAPKERAKIFCNLQFNPDLSQNRVNIITRDSAARGGCLQNVATG